MDQKNEKSSVTIETWSRANVPLDGTRRDQPSTRYISKVNTYVRENLLSDTSRENVTRANIPQEKHALFELHRGSSPDSKNYLFTGNCVYPWPKKRGFQDAICRVLMKRSNDQQNEFRKIVRRKFI